VSGSPQPGWPTGVRELGVGDLKRLGIDGDNQIYWDGRRIEIRKSIVLTGFQKWVAFVVGVVGLLAGQRLPPGSMTLLSSFARGILPCCRVRRRNGSTDPGNAVMPAQAGLCRDEYSALRHCTASRRAKGEAVLQGGERIAVA
jgi:hypothetical protein